MNELSWIDRSRPFLEAIDTWFQDLPALRAEALFAEPAQTALLCVDLTVGFSYQGALSSPRVAAIVPPIVELFGRAHDLGVRHFLLPQDAHAAEALEFEAFAPHAIAGTAEAETVPELRTLPFSHLFQVLPKNTIDSSLETDLDPWLERHPEVHTVVVVGDCTDFCVYQLAMHLRLQANARAVRRRVVVPANCVDTYDLSVETARTLGILPHHGDLLHILFLYHMAVNGIEVVREIA